MSYYRVPLSVEVRKVLKLLSYTLFALLIASSVYFFIKTSGTAESGYALRESQIRLQDLESENRILKQRVLDLQSLGELQKSDAVKGLIQPGTTTYVSPPGPVTKRR